jgi:hypothetical protein
MNKEVSSFLGAVSFRLFESSFGGFNERFDFLENTRLVVPVKVVAKVLDGFKFVDKCVFFFKEHDKL